MLALIMMLGVVSVGAQQQMPKIPADPNVRIGKLENGLTYYIRHNEYPKGQADYYIAQKVGSILENDDQQGLAHFLEHMCFNGTVNFPGKTLINYLESIGVKFGADLNAYTSIDETVYNISNVPTTREGIADSCLLMLHDWADGLLLEGDEIDDERGVIHEEWRTRRNAQMRMLEDKVLPDLYPKSKYSHRMPIGLMEIVDNFPHKVLRDYYEKWYRPDQQGIVVVGDIDVDKIEAKIKELFSPIKMPENAAERVYEVPAMINEPIISIATDKEASNTSIMLMYKHEKFPNQYKEYVPYMVQDFAKNMIATMLNSRLAEISQQANPPFIGAGAYDGDYLISKTMGAFNVNAMAAENGQDKAFMSVYREVKRARDFGFTASEYERAKADYLKGLEGVYKERAKQQNSFYVKQYVRNFIDNDPIPSIETEYQLMNMIVPQLPIEAINQVMAQISDEKNLAVVFMMPEKEGVDVPTVADVEKMMAEVNAEKLEPYKDTVSDEPLLSKLPEGGKIVATDNGAFGSKVYQLSNGAKIIVKKTDYKDDEVRMYAFAEGGKSLFPTKDIVDVDMMSTIAALGGYGNFSKIDLGKVLAGKNLSVTADLDQMKATVSGYCVPSDFEDFMQMTYLEFTAPRKDMEAFESFKSKMKAQLDMMAAMPQKALMDAINKGFYGDNPRKVDMTSALVDKIDYDKCLKMYNKVFGDASDFTFIFVGNFDEAKDLPLVEKYIGGLPAGGQKHKYVAENIPSFRKGEYRDVFHKDLETPKATEIFLITGDKFEYTMRNDLMAGMLSDLLNTVYLKTVREEEGGSYGVGVGAFMIQKPQPQVVMQIQFDTDPNIRAKMVKIILDELDKFVENGADQKELDKIKENKYKEFASKQKKNGYWLGRLIDQYWGGVNSFDKYEETVESITMKDIQKFAKKLFAEGNRVEVCMTSGDTK